MTMTNNKVTAEKTKGLVQLIQAADSLIHLIWKDRTTGAVVDDLIIFPEDATVKKLQQTSSRVLLLEFKASGRKLFFWMQEPKDDKDDEYVSKLNQYINNPPAPDQQEGGANESAGLPGGLDQNLLRSMFGQQQQPAPSVPTTAATTSAPAPPTTATTPAPTPTPAPAPTTATTTPATTSTIPTPAATANASNAPAPSAIPNAAPPASMPMMGGSLQIGDLANILSGFGIPQPSQPRSNQPNLANIITAEAVLPVLSNPQVQEQLLPYLPEERRTPEELRAIFRSPQLYAALSAFNSALQSGQLGEMMRQFGLSARSGVGVQEFLQALQEHAVHHQQQQPKQGGGTGDKNDKMDTS